MDDRYPRRNDDEDEDEPKFDDVIVTPGAVVTTPEDVERDSQDELSKLAREALGP